MMRKINEIFCFSFSNGFDWIRKINSD
jgi:hypothetical protein